jgi:DNA-binding transcriptional ArsR family regulator
MFDTFELKNNSASSCDNATMRLLFHPEPKQITLAGVLYALGDPVRLEIVQKLANCEELCCAGLDCSVAKSTMSHHFKILRESGVVFSRKDGTQLLNSLRKAELDEQFPGLMDSVLASLKA